MGTTSPTIITNNPQIAKQVIKQFNLDPKTKIIHMWEIPDDIAPPAQKFKTLLKMQPKKPVIAVYAQCTQIKEETINGYRSIIEWKPHFVKFDEIKLLKGRHAIIWFGPEDFAKITPQGEIKYKGEYGIKVERLLKPTKNQTLEIFYKQLGLDITKMKKAYEKPKFKEAVNSIFATLDTNTNLIKKIYNYKREPIIEWLFKAGYIFHTLNDNLNHEFIKPWIIDEEQAIIDKIDPYEDVKNYIQMIKTVLGIEIPLEKIIQIKTEIVDDYFIDYMPADEYELNKGTP